MNSANEMNVEFDSAAKNESFARVIVASFITSTNPTLEEVSDIKTAVSEAVTNAVVHGYDHKGGILEIDARIEDEWLEIEIEDEGIGIDDVKQAMEPLYTSRPDIERSGMGFTVVETFMDDLKVESEKGTGTKVVIKKKFNMVS